MYGPTNPWSNTPTSTFQSYNYFWPRGGQSQFLLVVWRERRVVWEFIITTGGQVYPQPPPLQPCSLIMDCHLSPLYYLNPGNWRKCLKCVLKLPLRRYSYSEEKYVKQIQSYSVPRLLNRSLSHFLLYLKHLLETRSWCSLHSSLR